jgi:hypothetical protein
MSVSAKNSNCTVPVTKRHRTAHASFLANVVPSTSFDENSVLRIRTMTCMHVRPHMHIHIRAHAHTYSYITMHTYMHMYIRMHAITIAHLRPEGMHMGGLQISFLPIISLALILGAAEMQPGVVVRRTYLLSKERKETLKIAFK